MKIGIMGTRGIPNQYGGFEQFAQSLSAGLAAKGHDVYVYNSSLHPYQEKKWSDVHIIHCTDKEDKIGTAGQFIYDRNCIADARKRNYDVLLHLGYTSDSVWFRRWPSNTVNMVNMDGMEWKREKYNAITRLFLKQAEAWAVKHADTLIADSAGVQQYIHETYNKHALYIPYGAAPFEEPDPSALAGFSLSLNTYYLAIARMEPENNIEMIIRGYKGSGSKYPLLIIGNTGNRFGKKIKEQYQSEKIIFPGSVYDQSLLNNLRFHSLLYFHGHSVGGTNPSLLEAMACQCSIAAHNNIFNRSILGTDASYFLDEKEIAGIISATQNDRTLRKKANLEKIKTIYRPELIIDAYEAAMLTAVSLRTQPLLQS